MTRIIDAHEIARALGGKKVAADEYACLCPAHEETTESCWVKQKDGKVLVHCFAGCTQESLILALHSRGLWSESAGNGSAHSDLPPGISPVWPPSSVLRKNGQAPGPETQKTLAKVYAYRGPTGEPLGYTARYEGHGKKDIIPFFRKENRRFRSGHLGKINRPLYGLDLLAKNSSVPILVVEGEKVADRLNQFFNGKVTTVTWPGGAKSVKGADWIPVASLQREIILCPDYDRPGYSAMAEVARQLVVPTNFLNLDSWLGSIPESGWDLADATDEQLQNLNETIYDHVSVLSPDEIKKLAREKFKSEKPENDELATEEQKNEKPPTGIRTSGGFEHSDLGNAERFIAKYGENIIYLPAEDCFYLWNGKFWEKDFNDEALIWAGETARSIAEDAKTAKTDEAKRIIKFATQSCAAKNISAILKLAKPKISHRPEELDADKWLINCANGVVDLRTGKLLPHDRSYKMAQFINYDYDAALPCPNWEKFLERVMEGDENMIAFLQRSIGYTISGSTKEQKFFLIWGQSGSNGKSVFLETLKKIMGSYATQSDSEMLTMDRFGNGSHPNAIARLKDARFVITNELQKDAVLNEARVKEMTGEDTMSARFLYKEFFEMKPQAKFWVRSNHRPEINGTDGGTWRRMLCIPFRAVIGETEKDKDLQHKLLEEAPGILAWCVRGCLSWQKHGLTIPQAVVHETSVYRSDMDILGHWIEERCIVGEDAVVSAKYLYEDYLDWCKEAGERFISQKKLGINLRERGFLRKRVGHARQYLGIRLKDLPSPSRQEELGYHF